MTFQLHLTLTQGTIEEQRQQLGRILFAVRVEILNQHTEGQIKTESGQVVGRYSMEERL